MYVCIYIYINWCISSSSSNSPMGSRDRQTQRAQHPSNCSSVVRPAPGVGKPIGSTIPKFISNEVFLDYSHTRFSF